RAIALSPLLLRTKFLTFDLPGLKLALLHCTKPIRPGAINVRDTGANPDGPEGHRRSAPRRSECPVRRVREAGEHQRRRGEERLRRLDRQYPRAARREG